MKVVYTIGWDILLLAHVLNVSMGGRLVLVVTPRCLSLTMWLVRVDMLLEVVEGARIDWILFSNVPNLGVDYIRSRKAHA